MAVMVTACGGPARSIHPTMSTPPPAAAAPQQTITAGQLTFEIPSSWDVEHGTCRCGWGQPDTATLDNGPQQGGVACNCPMESSAAPSGLHLYEGQGGLISGGRLTVINGLRARVELDTSDAALTAVFPEIDQWMTISPDPLSRKIQPIALEKRILATVHGRP
jgi:hypothetical protein